MSTDTVFFRPEAVTGPICPSGCAPDPSKGFDAFLRGLLTAPAQEIDTFIVDDIRNFLFREVSVRWFEGGLCVSRVC